MMGTTFRALFILKVPFPTECFKNSFFGIPSSTGGRMFVIVGSVTHQSVPWISEMGARSCSVVLRGLEAAILEGDSRPVATYFHFNNVPVRVSV